VYDVTSEVSFINVKKWLQDIDQNIDARHVGNRMLGNIVYDSLFEKGNGSFIIDMSNICFLSVGNKNDSPEKKVVRTEDAQKFADEIGIQLYETSAKENLNVQEVGI
jgi:Ras-related protein Rab-35